MRIGIFLNSRNNGGISLYLGSLRLGGLVLANCNANRRGEKELAGCLACYAPAQCQGEERGRRRIPARPSLAEPPVAGSGLGHCALPSQALAVAFASWSQAFGARRCRIYSHRTCVLVSLYAERLHFFSKIYFYFSSSVTLKLHQNDTTMLE